MESKLDEVLELLRGVVAMNCKLVATNRKLSKVHEWWLKQSSNRSRQQKCRVGKCVVLHEDERYRRSCTIKNNPLHGLMNSEATMVTAKPKMENAMMNRLSQFVNVDDIPDWFRMQAVLSPRNTFVLLFSLYNNCTWVPWVGVSGNNMRVFREWKEDGKPCFTYPAAGQVLPRINPPNRWTDSAVVAFCESWFWKVCTIVFRFVDGIVDVNDPELGEFKNLMDVTCSFSSYKVIKDLEWDPCLLYNWDRCDALKAYRKVAPRLKVLRTAFETGIVTSIESLVQPQNPK
jgi:hypothetical protein